MVLIPPVDGHWPPGSSSIPLEGVVEQPPDAIAIAGIVLAGVNSPWAAAMLWAQQNPECKNF
jgi:hypothetical protein